MANLTNIAEDLSQLTVLEAAELAKLLEEKWGVSASAPAAVMMAPSATTADSASEKDAFDVVLASVGGNKISVIKEVRSITGLGLAEAKALVDSAPKTVKEGLKKSEAEELKKKLEGAGATVELK